MLTIPLQTLLNFLIIVPFALAIYLSLTNWIPQLGPWWEAPVVGGENYAKMLVFGRFINAITVTLSILVVAVPLEFLIGLGIALMFYSWSFKGKAVFVSALLMPMMILPVVTGFTFGTLLYDQGPVNQFLSTITGIQIVQDWVSNRTLAWLAVVLADVWQWTPFMFLLLYAGLMALPADPIRAARVLGASERQIFRHIMLPMLKPIIMIALIIRSLEIFKIFDVPFILTGGGPGNTTETISIWMYKQAIEFGDIAFTSAGAIIIFASVIIAVLAVFKHLIPPR